MFALGWLRIIYKFQNFCAFFKCSEKGFTCIAWNVDKMYINFRGKNLPIYQKIWFKQIYLFLFEIASSKLGDILLEMQSKW